jgi:hypothetical protein
MGSGLLDENGCHEYMPERYTTLWADDVDSQLVIELESLAGSVKVNFCDLEVSRSINDITDVN